MTALLSHWRAHVLGVALVAGLATSTVVRSPSGVVAALGVVAAAAGAALGDPRARLGALAAALVLAGWWWGSGRLDALDRSILLPQVGAAGDARLVVTAPARRSRFETRVAARTVSFRGRVVREAVQLELPPGRGPPQGAVLELFGTLQEPESGRDFDEREWLSRRGVHVTMRANEWRVVGARDGLGGLADRLRRGILRGLAGAEGERRAVLAGIALGEDEGLSEELGDAFRVSGLYHLLAVSGQNIAFVAGGVLLFAWLAGVPRRVTEILVLLAIGGYVLAVGWQPSVIRAGVAGALASLALLTSRERDRWWLMVVGAAVLLAWNPNTLLDPGFQMSFAAVAAIFLAVRPLLRFLEGYPVPRALAIVLAVTGACGAATAPILWLHFGAVPLYSIPANALAAPVVAPLLGLALVAGVLAPVAPAAAFALSWLDGWLAAYLAGCARAIAALPFAQLTSGRAVAAIGLAALAAAAFARLRAPRPLRAVALAGMLVLATVGWSVRAPPARLPPAEGLRLVFLDVGQGDGVLVEAPGVRLLVDQGPPEARIADQLLRLGVRRVTALVLTHPQRDHVGGAAEVLRKLEVGFVLDPQLASSSPEQRAAIAEARRRDVPVVVARAGRVYRVGGLRLAVLWPDGPGTPSEDPNLRAIVLVATYGSVDALLTADAESDVTLPLDLPPVEILKVAHHGSADERLPELLERTRPRVAVISVGLGNAYGHPARSTLSALGRAPGLRVYRTDLDGRIVVESDGRAIRVDEER